MIFTINLHPNSAKGQLVSESDDAKTLTVYLREKPHDNAANLALIKLLSKYFGVAKSRIKIVGGQKSRVKRVEIDDDANPRDLSD